MTAPHIGNTGVNDEDFESRRVWVDGYVVRDPARVPQQLALQPQPRRPARRARHRRHQRHRHPGADAAPARARRHARRPSVSEGRSTSTTCWPRSTPRRRWPARTSWPTSRRPRRTSSRRSGEKRFTVAALDLGIKGMTPRRMAERGIEVHVLPATSTLDDVLAVRARTACSCPTARATRPPPTTRSRCCRACSSARSPTSASAWATRSSAARSAAAPTSSATATAASTSRSRT